MYLPTTAPKFTNCVLAALELIECQISPRAETLEEMRFPKYPHSDPDIPRHLISQRNVIEQDAAREDLASQHGEDKNVQTWACLALGELEIARSFSPGKPAQHVQATSRCNAKLRNLAPACAAMGPGRRTKYCAACFHPRSHKLGSVRESKTHARKQALAKKLAIKPLEYSRCKRLRVMQLRNPPLYR